MGEPTESMGVWLIERTTQYGYDEYDSAVVYAATELEARSIHPNGYGDLDPDDVSSTWVQFEHVKATRIGTAFDGAMKGVVCASFNAG